MARGGGKRGASPEPSIVLDDAVKKYFANLIEPLAKSDEVASLLSRIDEQNALIDSLKADISEKDARIATLEDETRRLSHNQNIIRRRADDSEQYDRRYSCCINGIPAKKSGESEDVKDIVRKCYEKIQLDFDADKIDRCHRVGKPSLDPISKKMTQQIIVKFRSWDSRCAFYRARPKKNSAPSSSTAPVSEAPASSVGSGRRGASDESFRFGISLDLTRDRYKLLQEARAVVANNAEVLFAFADLNCRLTLRMKDGTFQHFNSIDELKLVLSRFTGVPTVVNQDDS